MELIFCLLVFGLEEVDVLFHFLDLPVAIEDDFLTSFQFSPQLIDESFDLSFFPEDELALFDLDQVEFVFFFELLL